MAIEEKQAMSKIEIKSQPDYNEVNVESTSEEPMLSQSEPSKKQSHAALYGLLGSTALFALGFFVIDPAVRGVQNPEINENGIKNYLHSVTFVALTWLIFLVTIVGSRRASKKSETSSLEQKNALLRKELSKMEREKQMFQKAMAAKEFEKTLEMESLHEKYKDLMEKKDARFAAIENEKHSYAREVQTLRMQMQTAQQKSDTLQIKNQLLQDQKKKSDWKFLEKVDMMQKDQEQMRAKYDEIVNFVKTKQIDKRGEPDFWTNLQKWMQKAMRRKNGLDDVLVELKKQERVRQHHQKLKKQTNIVDDLWSFDQMNSQNIKTKQKKKAPMENLWDFESA